MRKAAMVLGMLMATVLLMDVNSARAKAATPNQVDPAPTATNSAAPTATNGDIIDNGTIKLGVRDEGNLNVNIPGKSTPSWGSGTRVVGLRYMPTNAEALALGGLYEGWGVADAASGEAGYVNPERGGVVNLNSVSFSSTASTAVSTVRIGTTFKVTHHYHPSPATPNLYESVVMIRNISTATVEPRYRRVMDWDVEPTPFGEFVTANIGTTTALLFNNNYGFSTSNPLGPREDIVTGNFTDIGPSDQGALFDFGFDPLAPGESVTFKIFYGAAANEAAALSALDAVGAEVYSLAQPDTIGGPTLGTPNTFIFGFAEAPGTEVPGTPAERCTISGTKGSDFLRGTMGKDVICAKDGSDVVEGRGGNDVLRAGPGGDTVEGGAGADRLYGEEGSDALDSADGVRGNDAMHGDRGTDACLGDRGDTKKGCEASK